LGSGFGFLRRFRIGFCAVSGHESLHDQQRSHRPQTTPPVLPPEKFIARLVLYTRCLRRFLVGWCAVCGAALGGDDVEAAGRRRLR